MKKIFLTAVAAGALAAGGAASAQDIGAVIGNIFGYGTPQYSYGTQYPYGTPATPAVVAGTQPYYGSQPYYRNQPYNTVYVDQYGRQVYVDQYGRHIVQSNGTGYQTDAWGRPVYNTTPYGTYAYGGSNWDRDGDGIANTRDRWPDDRRYY